MWICTMNNMQLKSKLKNISNKKKTNFNTILRNYMYERFIERLANSNYKDNFIFKGGFYLSTIFGVDLRNTMDIDLSIKNEKLSEENILKIFNEIINIATEDNAKIVINKIEPIKEENEYGGFRVKITVYIENIKETFSIDITTGDKITPKEILFKYKTLLDYQLINLKSYNLETILAEKVETILSRGELNSRAKDFYDVYLIYNIAKEKLNNTTLRNAIKATFENREFNGDIGAIIEIIKNSEILKTRWNAYSKTNVFSKEIKYESIMKCLDSILNLVEPSRV